ncbi:MAG: heat-inducible transcriptional repressor HrcA [Elusimicrobiales bacterium]|nr:heat-inducible transcriptional repressor HrcA [Elusimicrobiales bacterium]
MRILKPEIANQRKEAVLNWLTHRYIVTGKPVSSQEIYDANVIKVSPATIRNILKQLEEEGYLQQLHTSGGRIPTDKAYRFYIDSILKTQTLAEAEKEKIEIEYERKMAELDHFLRNTTKILSDLTKKVGFSMVSDIKSEEIKRIDIIDVSHQSYILVVITTNGLIRHFPFTLKKIVEKSKIRSIVLLLNKKCKGLPITEALQLIKKDYLIKDDTGIFESIAMIFESVIKDDDEIFIEGLSKIYEETEEFSFEEIKSMAKLLEEKERFSKILKERFSDALSKIKMLELDGTKAKKHVIDVSIGSENNVKELGNFSIVTSSYCIRDKSCGLLGIVGHRRMEYPRVISIIDTVSSVVEEVISEWEKEFEL